jgi:hypothetical protein
LSETKPGLGASPFRARTARSISRTRSLDDQPDRIKPKPRGFDRRPRVGQLLTRQLEFFRPHMVVHFREIL